MHLSIEGSRKALPVCAITARYFAATFPHVDFSLLIFVKQHLPNTPLPLDCALEYMYMGELRHLYVSQAPEHLI